MNIWLHAAILVYLSQTQDTDMTRSTSVPWPFQPLQELSFLVTSALACMLVISFYPCALALSLYGLRFLLCLPFQQHGLTHSSQNGMNGRKGRKREAEMTEREEGREGGKVSKVLPACGAHRRDAVDQSWLEQKEQGKCVYVCLCASVCWGWGGETVNTTSQLLLQQTIHAMIKSLRG